MTPVDSPRRRRWRGTPLEESEQSPSFRASVAQKDEEEEARRLRPAPPCYLEEEFRYPAQQRWEKKLNPPPPPPPTVAAALNGLGSRSPLRLTSYLPPGCACLRMRLSVCHPPFLSSSKSSWPPPPLYISTAGKNSAAGFHSTRLAAVLSARPKEKGGERGGRGKKAGLWGGKTERCGQSIWLTD